ncbi:hypothetical protein OIU76_009474 [Salix suchowensis]|nr:hypothetical protein OIU76_009474 [Salix suchowensis]
MVIGWCSSFGSQKNRLNTDPEFSCCSTSILKFDSAILF